MKRMTRQGWDEVIDVNLGGCFNMAKAVFDGCRRASSVAS
jgi:acetoacetyl-CoA reductase